MSDSRERFIKWRDSLIMWSGTREEWELKVWAAAEAETARRCAEIAGETATRCRIKYKGTREEGIRRGGSYDPHDDGMSDGAAVVEDAIRTEFSEAFK